MDKEYYCDECDFTTDNIGALGSHRKYIHGKDGRFAKKSLEQRLNELVEEVHGMPELTKGEVEEIIRRELANSDFCQRFPDLCKRVERIEDVVGGHPIPSEQLLQVWGSCEECRPKLERLVKSGTFKAKEETEDEEEQWTPAWMKE